MNRDIEDALRLARKTKRGRRGYDQGGAPQNPVTAAAPAQPDYQGFLQNLYQTNFNRAADQGGLDAWTKSMQGGASAQSVADAFRNSQEAQALAAKSGGLHKGFIDTEEELSPLVQQYGMPISPPNAGGNPGYATGNPNYGGFVGDLYQQNFNRAADQPGMDFWTQQMQNGVSAQDVATRFAMSDEGRQAMQNGQLPSRIIDTYSELAPLVNKYQIPGYYAPSNATGSFLPKLDPVQPSGPLPNWNPNIPPSDKGTPDLNPKLDPTNPTAQPSTPGTGGTPTTPGNGDNGTSPTNPIPKWNPYIDVSGVKTPAFAPTLEQLQNNQIAIDPSNYKDFTTSLFNEYLGRAPEQAAQDFFSSFLEKGGSPAELATIVATSPEAQTNQVGSLYQYMLGREGDQGGVAYFKDMINQGKMNLNDVASLMMSSPEYQNYMDQTFEANRSGFTPVNQYDFAATTLPKGVGKTGEYSVGYLDPNVWQQSRGNEVFPTSFASTILKNGPGADQQIPAGYIDPNVMLSAGNQVADKYQFAANALKSGLGENGVYKPYVDASINAQKVNDLINNMDPQDPGNYVTGVYNALTGRNMDPAKAGQLTTQLTAGNITPEEIAATIAKENNVPLPPSRPMDIAQPSTPGAPTPPARPGDLANPSGGTSGVLASIMDALSGVGRAVVSGVQGLPAAISKPLTGMEQAVVDMISKREGAKDPNTIFGGDRFSKAIGYAGDLTNMTLDQVFALQDKLHKATKAAGVANGVGTSAVGAGQFIKSTLQNTLKSMGIGPDQWSKLKFTPELQNRVTIQNFKNTVGDPNRPNTWNRVALGKQWESMDTSKGFAPLSKEEIGKVIAAKDSNPTVSQDQGTAPTPPTRPGDLSNLNGGTPSSGPTPTTPGTTPTPTTPVTDSQPEGSIEFAPGAVGPGGNPIAPGTQGGIAPGAQFGYFDDATGQYNAPQIADNASGYYTYETKSVPIYKTVYSGGTGSTGPSVPGATALPTIHVGGHPHQIVVGHKETSVPIFHSGPAPEGTPAGNIVYAHNTSPSDSGGSGDIFGDLFGGDTSGGGDIFADAGDFFGGDTGYVQDAGWNPDAIYGGIDSSGNMNWAGGWSSNGWDSGWDWGSPSMADSLWWQGHPDLVGLKHGGKVTKRGSKVAAEKDPDAVRKALRLAKSLKKRK